MKKRGAKIKRKAHAPAMVAMLLNPEVEIAERMAVEALTQAYASTSHFNVLWDCHAMLIFSLDGKTDPDARAIIEMSSIALENISDRYHKHKSVRATGDELSALRALVDFSADYWKRQGGGRFADAYTHVTRCRQLYK